MGIRTRGATSRRAALSQDRGREPATRTGAGAATRQVQGLAAVSRPAGGRQRGDVLEKRLGRLLFMLQARRHSSPRDSTRLSVLQASPSAHC
ncbi:MAG: hypothetical protein Q8P67_27040 [archaeon]|nr:hypothetical protein [archaeon]